MFGSNKIEKTLRKQNIEVVYTTNELQKHQNYDEYNKSGISKIECVFVY